MRRLIFERDGFTCQYCGFDGLTPDGTIRRIPWGWNSSRVTLDIDHIYPRSKGGWDVLANLLTACVWCNLEKGAREWVPPLATCDECRQVERDPIPIFTEIGPRGAVTTCVACCERRGDTVIRGYVDEIVADELADEVAYYDLLIADGWDVAA